MQPTELFAADGTRVFTVLIPRGVKPRVILWMGRCFVLDTQGFGLPPRCVEAAQYTRDKEGRPI